MTDAPATSRRSWTPRALVLGSLVVLGAVALVVLLFGWAHDHRNSGWVTLTAGTYHGVGWELQASMSNGKLCMQLTGPAGQNDPANSAGGYPGQCQFDRSCELCSYTGGGLGPANSYSAFGPLPVNATQIRIATHKVLASSPFPGGHGLPSGRYWLDIHPTNWPASSPGDGTRLATPQPLDALGHTVKFQNF
jgi:hypothetical protein